MSSKFGVIANVPPGTHGFNASPFLDNLRACPPSAPLVLFGVEGTGDIRPIPDFQPLIKGPKWPHMSNYAFLTAMEIAEAEGWEKVLYVEEDCRFGRPGWDEPLWAEFAEVPRAVVGGTPAIWHYGTSVYANNYLRLWIDKVRQQTGQRAPILFDKGGFSHGPEHSKSPWLHPIGALAIYDLRWLRTVFPGWNKGGGQVASGMGPFDVHIGKALWTTYGNDQFSHFAPFRSSFSGYKDHSITLDQRKAGLLKGDFTAVHPIKDGWAVVIP